MLETKLWWFETERTDSKLGTGFEPALELCWKNRYTQTQVVNLHMTNMKPVGNPTWNQFFSVISLPPYANVGWVVTF